MTAALVKDASCSTQATPGRRLPTGPVRLVKNTPPRSSPLARETGARTVSISCAGKTILPPQGPSAIQQGSNGAAFPGNPAVMKHFTKPPASPVSRTRKFPLKDREIRAIEGRVTPSSSGFYYVFLFGPSDYKLPNNELTTFMRTLIKEKPPIVSLTRESKLRNSVHIFCPGSINQSDDKLRASAEAGLRDLWDTVVTYHEVPFGRILQEYATPLVGESPTIAMWASKHLSKGGLAPCLDT